MENKTPVGEGVKSAVVGSRGFTDYDLLKSTLDMHIGRVNNVIIVSGGCGGADQLGERYAKEKGFQTEILKPDWVKHRKAAGMIRNTDIVNSADMLFAFKKGETPGTNDSIQKAIKKGIPVIIKYQE